MLNVDLGFDNTFRVSVKNVTGSSIAANKAVAIAGYDATDDLLQVQLADNSTGKPAIGVVESAIDNNGIGTAVKYGLLPYDTSGTTIGDLLYLGTNGDLTYTLPAGLVVRQELGRVAYVNASGYLYLFPKPYSPLTPGVPSMTTSFFNSSATYLEYNTTSWQAAAQWPYVGTDIWRPYTFVLIASRSGTSGTSYVRLADITNNNEISNIAFTSSTLAFYEDTTLLNLPANQAILEIDTQKSSGGASKTRIHSVALY
ncbi:MAG: hypothetical protein GF411_14085 [Candidatus Lokiarchaeota archaeon]|nr:hypothetical protein [Candidatus Lokiarchaeota archaeon]